MSTAPVSTPPLSIGPMSTGPMSTGPMSTAPVFFTQTAGVRATERQSRVEHHPAAMQPPANALAAKVPASWQLTDRGIAVIMVIAGVIMTVALLVIGLTAMRVTSADYDAGWHTSPQVQH
jgi:hypothetical protein